MAGRIPRSPLRRDLKAQAELRRGEDCEDWHATIALTDRVVLVAEPEFIAYAVADWCRFNETDTVFIDPGNPWQSAGIESFNGRLRDELLNGQRFYSQFETQVLLEDWQIDNNINGRTTLTAGSPPSSSSRLSLHRQQLTLAWVDQQSGSSHLPTGPRQETSSAPSWDEIDEP